MTFYATKQCYNVTNLIFLKLSTVQIVPSVTSVPSVRAVLSVPSVPSVPALPSVPRVPSVPSVPAVSSVPSALVRGVAPFKPVSPDLQTFLGIFITRIFFFIS